MIKKIIFFMLLVFLFQKNCFSFQSNQDINKANIKEYLLNIDRTIIEFEQQDSTNVVNGKIFIKDKKIRLEYNNPNFVFIINGNKFVYYDVTMNQISHFSNKNISELNFFNNEKVIDKIIILDNQNNIIKTEISCDDRKIWLFFYANPIKIKKIFINDNNNGDISIDIKNIFYAKNIDDKMFYVVKKIKHKNKI